MIRIADRKTALRAETSARYRAKPLMISVEPYEVLIREKNRRQAYAVPWLAVYELGMKLAAIEKKSKK